MGESKTKASKGKRASAKAGALLASAIALHQRGQLKEAEAVYREDLRRNRANGWSLFGLTKALKAQGRTRDAANAQAMFDKAWANADIKLTGSAF